MQLTIPGVAMLVSIENPTMAHAGESVSVVSRFVDVGIMPVRIREARIATEFGTFTLLSTNPCQYGQYAQVCCDNLCDIPGAPIIAPGENVSLALTIMIPS